MTKKEFTKLKFSGIERTEKWLKNHPVVNFLFGSFFQAAQYGRVMNWCHLIPFMEDDKIYKRRSKNDYIRHCVNNYDKLVEVLKYIDSTGSSHCSCGINGCPHKFAEEVLREVGELE